MQPGAGTACLWPMRLVLGLATAVVLAAATPARAQPGPVDPCAAGRRDRTAGHLARAHLALSLCARGEGADADAARAALPALEHSLRAKGYAAVTVDTDPPDARGQVDSLGELTFPTPFTVWLAPGVAHQVSARKDGYHGAARQVRVDDPSPFSLPLRLDPIEEKPKDEKVDFSDEGEVGAVQTASDLPGAKHDDLLPTRYRGGIYAPDTQLPRSWHVGLAIGAGRTDLIGGGGARARLGLAVAALLDYQVRGRFHVVPEVGVAQRGGDQASVTQLTVPIAAAVRPRSWLELGAGPELAINLAKDLPDTATFELGANAATRLLLAAGPGRLFVELGAHLGLTPTSGDARTTAATARLGYLY